MNKKMRIEYLEAVIASQMTPNAITKTESAQPGTYFFLDVRGNAKELKDTIPNATIIALDELELRLDELPKDKIIAILPWSPICIMAKKASLILLQHDFECIEIVGGIKAWKNSKLPTVKL